MLSSPPFSFAPAMRRLQISLVSVVDETTPCRPAAPYEVTKRAAEQGLLTLQAETGLEVAIVRPCLIAGAGQRGGMLLKLFRLGRRGLFPVLGGRLEVQKPLVAVEDVVQALLRAALVERSGGLWLVTSGERHTLGQILVVVGGLTGNPRPYLPVPMPLGRLAAALSTPLARALRLEPPLSPERLELFLADRAIDIARARSELGYEPQHRELEPMLARSYAWYVESRQL